MANPYPASLLGLTAFVLLLAGGGFHFESSGAHVSVSISPASLVAWPLFLLSAILASRTSSIRGETKASWWRNGLALVVDFSGLLTILMLPLAAAALYRAIGHLPPPWEYAGELSGGAVSALFIPLFAAIWSGLGFALHPCVTTPGQLISGVSANTRADVSSWDLAFRGVFAYYGLFIPLFGRFAGGLEAVSTIRVAQKSSTTDSDAISS